MENAGRREITAINTDLPLIQFGDEVNKKLAQLEGIAKSFNHVYYEVKKIISGLGLNDYYKTKQAIGNSESDYNNWTVFSVEDGYNIWKYPVSDYAYDENNSLRIDHKIIDFMDEAIAATGESFDKVYIRSGGTFIDNTAEAATAEGTPFNLMVGTSEELLIGKADIFSGADFTFYKPGSGYALSYSYSKSTGFGSGLTGTAIRREDNTNGFVRDGLMRINFPGDFAPTDLNGHNYYWLRLQTQTPPTQPAKAFAIQPSTNVRNLLSLSSEELLKNDVLKWCSFDSNIYVTLKNKGNFIYEGRNFITSGVSDSNKRAYFINNHKFEADYKDTDYAAILPSRAHMSFFDPCDTALKGRYANVGKDISGLEGHVMIRPGYLTGMGITAVTAPDVAQNFVVRKNRVGTVMTGTLSASAFRAQKGDYTPISVNAGETVQVFAEPSSQATLADVVIDVEFLEVNIG